jgi:hypothetical protein
MILLLHPLEWMVGSMGPRILLVNFSSLFMDGFMLLGDI